MTREETRDRLIAILRELEQMAADTQDDARWEALDQAVSAVDDAQIAFAPTTEENQS